MSNVVVLTIDNFEQQLEASDLTLVCVWAPWSAPAKQTALLMEQIATEYAGRATIATVNMDE